MLEIFGNQYYVIDLRSDDVNAVDIALIGKGEPKRVIWTDTTCTLVF